jgi:hypothetical protein
MLAIAPDELETAGIFAWEIHQTNREIFGELLALPHKNPERVFSIFGFQSHIVALHLSIQTHFTARWIDHLLGTSDQPRKFFICECSHDLTPSSFKPVLGVELPKSSGR